MSVLEKLKLYLEREDGTLAEVSNVFEKITDGIKNTNSDHSAHHSGYGNLASSLFSLNAGAIKEFSFKSPSTLYAHLKNIKLQTLGSSIKLEILKNVTVTTDTGTSVSIRNTNDNSSNVAQSTIKQSPTYSGGTVWDDAVALADSTNQYTGNAEINSSENQELITRTSNVYYILKFTNIGDSTAEVYFKMFFYEESKGLID